MLVGVGGAGKTRLALQLVAEWAAGGGTWQLVDAHAEGKAVAAARGVTSDRVLLMVDYAETRTQLPQLLRSVLDDPGPMWVLLIARSLGEWWDRLKEESPYAVARLLTEALPVPLDDPVNDAKPDAELAAAAVPYFGRALGVPVPGPVLFEFPARRMPVLVLHAAALVAVLRSAAEPTATLRVVMSGVLEELLEHEARYWRRTAAAAGLPDDGHVLKPVVAAAALLGAAGESEAAQAVSRVPELAGALLGELRKWARWLYGLYPPEADGRLGSLQPGLLAETHVTAQLAEDPKLARACLRGLEIGQAVHALTVLGRAWMHQENAKQIIAAALQDDLPRLAIPAAVVALQTQAGLGSLLATALREASAPLDVLIDIATTLPYPSVVLTRATAAVTLRVRASLPPGTEPWIVARWAASAGAVLSAVSREAEALSSTQEAVTLYRKLAEDDPDLYRPYLANSLENLGIHYGNVGQPAQALAMTQQAMTIWSALAEADPDRHRPGLASSLTHLGVWFSRLGLLTEALRAEQQAVAIRRTLAEDDPDLYRPYLANSLTNPSFSSGMFS